MSKSVGKKHQSLSPTTKSASLSTPKSSPAAPIRSHYLPLVSVIVPVYNVAKILERCVESIRKQVYPNLEIILIDDGSTDMSGAFCDVFAKKDPRIKVIHQENQGLSAARNAGLKLATGKWITFVDSDDTIRPDMIDLLHKMCYTNRTKMSICGFFEVKEGAPTATIPLNTYASTSKALTPSSASPSPLTSAHADTSAPRISKRRGKHPAQDTEIVLTTAECLKAMLCEEGFSMSAWGKLYARELFDLVRFPVGRLYEDVGTTYQLILQCDRIAVSSAQEYNYYQNSGSITQQSFTVKKLDLIDLTDKMCDDIIHWSKDNKSPDQAMLLNLTKKRRMHARFSILRQIVSLPPESITDPQSIKNAQQSVVKYLRQHKAYVLQNPLASRRDKLAMRSLQLGLPVFRYAWQHYSAKRK